jgi:transcriptional regulator with XRE-family HTH domain
MNKEQLIRKRIKTLRYLSKLIDDRQLTQAQIAEQTGYIQPNISRILSGQYSPSLDILTNIANAAGYDVAFVNQDLNTGPAPEIISPKFMLTLDMKNKELYILHRQWPSCLIWVKQEIPVRFIIQDLYDDVDNPADIIGMPFVEEAKQFFRDNATEFLDKN